MPAPKPEHTGLRYVLHSYRWRRRMLFIASFLTVVGAFVWISLDYTHEPSSAATGGKATIVAQPKTVPFTAAEKRQVSRTLKLFLSAAVGRHDVGAAWSVAGPQLRAGLTKREWSRGAIPVQPYPVARHGLGRWDGVEYSYHNVVGLSVFLFPKPGSGQAAATADVDVIKNRHGRWVVNYFMPNKYHGNPVPEKKKKKAAVVHHQKPLTKAQRRARARERAREAAAQLPPPPPPHASRLYWAIPVGVLALGLLTPILIFLFSWMRNKRAYNAYARRETP